MPRSRVVLCASVLSALAIACGGSADQSPSAETSSAAAASSTTNYGTDLQPDAGGSVITVGMMTDEQGNNRFDPANFEARRGDVIRYTLVTGVHNVNFLPDSNAGRSGLPPAGPMLQLPQQTYDVKVTWDAGTYYYQCDPHALLGMVGKVTVVR